MLQHQHQVVSGIDTDVIIQRFRDRTFVLVTQLGKVGNLIQATIPPTTVFPNPPLLAQQLPPPPPAIQLTNLLGSAPSEHMQTLHSLYVSQIATLVWVSESSTINLGRKAVVVGLALKKQEMEDGRLEEGGTTLFHGIMNVVRDMLGRYPGL